MKTMSKMKFVTLTLALSLAVVGCSSNGNGNAGTPTNEPSTVPTGTDEGAKETVELSFLVHETPNLSGQFWDAQIKKVTDKYPHIKINKIVSPDIDRAKYAKQLLATGDFPDVMISVNPAEFAASGALLPFPEESLAKFTQPNANLIDGKQYQLPWNTQTYPTMYYNKKIFDEVGVTPPATWSEFMEISEKIKNAGYTPLLYGGGSDPWATTFLTVAIIGSDVYAETPDWVAKRKNGEVKFSDPAFKNAILKWKEVVDKGYFNEDGLSLNYGQLEEVWFRGQTAMYPMGSWYISADAATEKDFEVGTFALPSDSGDPVIAVFTGGGTSVSAKTAHPEEAILFATEFASNPEIMAEFMKADGSIPALVEEVPFESTPLFDEQLEQLAKYKPVNSFGVEAGDDALLPGIKDAFDKMAQDIIMGADVESELAKLDKLWDDTAARMK
ncbi:extracellular solute-binding protein [Paenibacillus sp. PAMC21692]|nr:extracellular solute-binding protein [Paenibacillus sp. PAMC21692]